MSCSPRTWRWSAAALARHRAATVLSTHVEVVQLRLSRD